MKNDRGTFLEVYLSGHGVLDVAQDYETRIRLGMGSVFKTTLELSLVDGSRAMIRNDMIVGYSVSTPETRRALIEGEQALSDESLGTLREIGAIPEAEGESWKG